MKMRRLVSALLSMVLCFSLVTATVGAVGRDTSFEESLATNLKSLGLFKGVTETDFELERPPTRAEALVMLTRLLGKEAEALGGSWSHPFTDVASWQEPYVGYAYVNGLTKGRTATEFYPGEDANAAMYLTYVLRALGYSDTDGDFVWDNPYALARQAGILPEGVDREGFWRADVALVSYAALEANLKGSAQTLADKLIAAGAFTRAEYEAHYDEKALENRPAVSEPSDTPLSAQQIAEKCSDAVFYIDIYGFNGAVAGNGSGFFISADGVAVTNFHVAANAGALVITTADGKQYSDVDIIDSDRDNDLALLRVDGGPFPYLELGDSSGLKQGQQVYAIGSPKGLQNTMSQGIVSNPDRVLDGTRYVQISVPIAPGSSGGALLDQYGRAVGVTTAGFSDAGADLNLAMPINLVKALDTASDTSYFLWQEVYYPGLAQAYDFGAFSNVTLVDYAYTPLGLIVQYDVWDFHDLLGREASDYFAYTMLYYGKALQANGFTEVQGMDSGIALYESDTETVYVEVNYEESAIYVLAELLPVYYAECPALPDLGWYLGLDATGADYIDGSQVYSYLWTGDYSRTEMENALSWYFELLEEEGFACVYSQDDAFLFEGQGLSVVVGLSNRELFVDVAPL